MLPWNRHSRHSFLFEWYGISSSCLMAYMSSLNPLLERKTNRVVRSWISLNGESLLNIMLITIFTIMNSVEMPLYLWGLYARNIQNFNIIIWLYIDWIFFISQATDRDLNNFRIFHKSTFRSKFTLFY